MRELIKMQQILSPDLLTVMQQRYIILQRIQHLQPIGRRGLAVNTNLTERAVRSEVDFLHDQRLITITSKGMQLTNEGQSVVRQLADFMHELSGLRVLENKLENTLNVKNAIIVPGNSDENLRVKQEMGKACVDFLKKNIKIKQTIAVTGGTSMAAVADSMTPFEEAMDCLFVPARGGLGEKEENQANTIAAKMARKAKGQYRLLYVPDPLSETSYETMMKEPSVIEVLQLIKQAQIILHGIGNAITMAKRRKASDTIISELNSKNAVSEAFGYYFDSHGNIVHKVRTIGLHLDDLTEANQVITVAGGHSKANAITSYFKQGKSDVLITDEAAAEAILKE